MEKQVIEGYRLSPQQQVLFERSGAAASVAQVAIALEGALEVPRLAAALRRVVARHEILRTRFELLPGMGAGLQVVDEAARVELAIEPAGEGEEEGGAAGLEVEARLAGERAAPFELASGALLRARLWPQRGGCQLLVLTAPALCLDARSLSNLAAALAAAYAAGDDGSGGDGGDADDEPIQYVQFAEWQHQLDEEEDAARAAAFWQQQLTGELPALRLPGETLATSATLAAAGRRHRSLEVAMSPAASADLDRWLAARQLGAERYFLACWLLLLARAGDVSASGPAALATQLCCDGRTLAELDGALGPMAAPVPFRIAVDLAASGTRLLDAVAFLLREVQAFQSFCPRDRAAAAAPTTAFEYAAPPPALAMDRAGAPGALRGEVVARWWSGDERLALALVVTRTGEGGHSLRLSYDPARLDEHVVAGLARALLQLCAGLAERPHAPVGQLALLDAGEQRRLHELSGRGAAPVIGELTATTFVAGFAAAAARWPERVAYVYQDVELRYAALARRAHQVAHALIGCGVRPGMTVPMLLDRGPHVLAGLLGILEAGAAFLPLDPGQPPRRLEAILREVAAPVLITRDALRARIPDGAAGALAHAVSLDDPALDALPAEAPGVVPGPASPAYVLYTSGSTGAPKGVVIRHASVMNLARALQAEIYGGGGAPLRVSLNANLTFDSSVKQWTRLLFGDTLIGVPEEVRASGDELRAHLERHRCQLLDCTPSQLEILLAAGLPACLSRALLGGEAISPGLWQRLLELQRTTGCRFFNVYGPTECTVNAVWAPIAERPPGAGGLPMPVIGGPVPGCHIAICDAHGQPVPPGWIGELWIGGAGVATGYAADPRRTAERFVPDPFGGEPGARMYRSGDRVRLAADGALEFLGRVDHQVKLRGLRIELGEIEAALRRHPRVADCAVLLREDRPGDLRLVAYVVALPIAGAPWSGAGGSAAGMALPVSAASGAPATTGYQLPNGLWVAHQNKNETAYLYDEIFAKQTYACYGIELPDDAVVLDVGANIGMYSLYVLQHCRRPRIFAFEPLPPIAATLAENMRRHGRGVTVLPYGLSDREAQVEFTYYPYYSMMSGARDYARPEEEVEVVRRYLEKEAEKEAAQEASSAAAAKAGEARELLRHADELLRFRFEGQTHPCRLRRLTDVIREQGLVRVDVLKIDVQRAELDVLRGLAEHDWALIAQVVMEVHQDPRSESAGRVAEITSLLERHGFHVVAEQDQLLTGTDRFNLYASRRGLGVRAPAHVAPVAAELPATPVAPAAPLGLEELQRHTAAWLPDYMIPQAAVLLEALPLSLHGKVDRAALPEPDPDRGVGGPGRGHLAPRTAHEQALLEVWSEVLGHAQLGVEDDFFALGGHSLLATQLMARLRKRFAVELPLRLIFEAPTIARLAGKLAEQLARATTAVAPPITPAPRTGRLPLSFAQQRLWFIDQLEPGSAAYINPFAFRCRGPLAIDRLDRALVAVITRHEVLRTRFVAIAAEDAGGDPAAVAQQLVDPPAERYLALVDLSALPPAEREGQAAALRRAEAATPFDLARGPVFRTQLLRLAAEDHLLLFTAHHIACDEWSLPIFARELSHAYNALDNAAPDVDLAGGLPPLPVQVADVAQWQRQWLRGDELARQVAHWKRELAGLPPLLDLPIDRPRTTRRSYRGQRSPFELSLQASAALRELAVATSTTPFMLFLAAFAAMLSRTAGQRDLCIGIPGGGRQRLETEHLIGFFINVLPIRVDLSGAPSFRTLMARVRDAVLRGLAHQELPFEKLIEELELSRDLSHSPLFQVAFHLRGAQAGHGAGPDDELTLRGVTVDSAATDGGEPRIRYDLSLSIDNGGAEVRGALLSDAALFRPETAAALAAQLAQLLVAVAADPDRPLAALPWMDAAEERRLVAAANPVIAEVPADATLASLWRARVAAAPRAPAVCAGGRTLDTLELDALATSIARALRAAGVGPDRPVAILADRSCELVAGLLGILLAGGAYLPLDPAYPAARLAWMIDDAAPVAVLAQAHLAGRLPAGAAAVLLLDGPEACHRSSGAPDEAAAAVTALAPPLSADHLAYVLYTSGSTGKPKGVMVSHRNAVNLRAALGRAIYARPDLTGRPLRVSLNAPVVFDSSVKQLLTLFDGHCLYPVPEELRRDAERLVSWLAEQRLDVLDATPSLLRLLLDAGLLADPARAPRHVLVGGEAIAPDLWRTLRASTTSVFHNVYGPTECTVNATAHTLGAAPAGGAADAATLDDALPVIGRSLANVRSYVLDEQLRPVPPGITAELYLGGAGVARGYRGRPALTAERFLPDPFSPLPGGRMYRTGDLARTSAHGDLVFAGRVDHQVKLRGYRIELGEVEAALLEHPGVRQCVALVPPPRQAGGEQLVAYMVARPGHLLAPRAVREHAAARLPEHMVPSSIFAVAEIPLTVNKKVDLQALQAAAAVVAPAIAAPRLAEHGAIEEVVLVVLSELLGLPEIGLDQDFFTDLGGHSLLAIQLVSRLRTALGIPLELRVVFDQPTPRRLARLAEVRLRRGDAAAAPPLLPAPRDRPLPLSFAQRRLWILDRMEPGSAAYHNPKAIRLTGELDPAALARALSELVRRHEALRTRFVAPELDGEPAQVVDPSRPVELEVQDLSALAPAGALAEARRHAEHEAARPFDLAAGPLVRFQLLRLAPRDHVLLFTMHHIVTDARSLEILWREADLLYEAFAAGRPSPLPELTLQYADYAAWQHRWLTGEPLRQQLAYWQQRLAGLLPIELPCDHARPPIDGNAGQSHRFTLDAATAEALRRVAHAHGCTVFMAVLAAYAALLSRLCRQDDLAIGAPVSGRGPRDTEDMVGFFVNTLVLRCDLSGAPSFAQLLARVREAVLSAHAHQDVPFEKLVEALAPVRDPSRTPLFQVAMGYRELPPRRAPDITDAADGADAADDADAADGTIGARFALPSRIAKFDLTLEVTYQPGAELALALEYKTALFEPISVARIAHQLRVLVTAAVAVPQLPLAALELRDEAERAAMAAWNAAPTALISTASPSADLCLHQLIAAQAACTPDQLAVAFDDDRLTYAELLTRANQLAHRLRQLGVHPETVVAVLLPRSLELVVALLGILQAGGAYLPLDPEHPAERLAATLRDTSAALLLTCEVLAGRPAAHGAAVLRLEDEQPMLASQPSTAPRTGCTDEHLAYVIPTSGSTGLPKCVAIRHRSVVNRLRSLQPSFPLGATDRVLHQAPTTFDGSVWELFAPLLHGATAIMARRDRDPRYLARLIATERITCMDLVPAVLGGVLDALAEDEALRRACRLRRVYSGGEALTAALSERFTAVLGPGVELFNIYGPTEATVDVACWRYQLPAAPSTGTDGGSLFDPRPIPIGTPMPGNQLHILDAALRPLPIGMAGELCIGGVQVGRGYLGRPALTAAQFVPDPFSPLPGARLYRTGDLARYRPAGDGAIEYLGRLDAQVKVRGFRVELPEIESVLTRHPQVQHAAVALREQQLAAYVVPVRAEAPPEPAALREHLRHHLPEYMVPGSFTVLEALPRTTSGKVDRRALPAPAPPRAREHVHPRTPLEWLVWREMSEVLHLDTLGVSDPFFEVGGHSLAAVTLASRLRARCHRELPLAAIFQHPTVEQLAALLAGGDGGAAAGAPLASSLVELQPGADRPPWFWMHPVGGTAFCYAGLARAIGRDQPFYALQSPGLEPGSQPLFSMEALVQRYAELVAARRPRGRVHLGGWSMGGTVAFEVARHLAAGGRELAPVIIVDAFADPPSGRDATTGELVRSFLDNLKLSPEQLGLPAGGDWSVEQMLEALRAEAVAGGVLPPGVGREVVQRHFDVFAANARILHRHQAGSYTGDLVVVHRTTVAAERLASWSRLTSGRVHLIAVEGKHELLMSPPHVQEIAARLRELEGKP